MIRKRKKKTLMKIRISERPIVTFKTHAWFRTHVPMHTEPQTPIKRTHRPANSTERREVRVHIAQEAACAATRRTKRCSKLPAPEECKIKSGEGHFSPRTRLPTRHSRNTHKRGHVPKVLRRTCSFSEGICSFVFTTE